MMTKKKSQNGFICFVNDWRKRHSSKLSWEASISAAGIDWQKMSTEERLPYKTAALTYEGNKPTKPPQKQTQKLKQEQTLTVEEDQVRVNRQIDRMVQQSVQRFELEKQTYCFIMVNYFAKIANSDMYQPAEIAVSEFSLQEGVRRVFHKLINPGPSPYGSKYETQIHANDTHQLPIPPNAIGEDNLEELFKQIMEFIETPEQEKNESQPIFTTKEQIPIVSSALEYLNSGAHELKIYSIEYLLFVLKNASCQISGTTPPKSIYEANLIFERDPYEHELNISCDYHERRDLSKHCSQSYVTRWGYMFANSMCNDLAISKLPKFHKPHDSNIRMILIEANQETEELLNKPKISNVDAQAEVKTEYLNEEHKEDLWKDLDTLTDILEQEIGESNSAVIKMEPADSGNDSNDGDDAVTAPPPPPISLKEVDDEFTRFMRRMETNKPKDDGKVKSEKPTSSTRTNPKKERSEETKDKKILQKNSIDSISKPKKTSRNGTAVSRTENSSSRKRSRSKRKDPRSKRNSSRSRSSRSPRRRSITRNHKRRENRISRSISRERQPYRRRSCSSESDLNLQSRSSYSHRQGCRSSIDSISKTKETFRNGRAVSRTENGSSRKRSRSRRKDPRSTSREGKVSRTEVAERIVIRSRERRVFKSREHRPYRRDTSHSRRSRSPRRRSINRIHERRENHLRIVRRISRSVSRERQLYRSRSGSRKSYSRERQPYRRRSRSRKSYSRERQPYRRSYSRESCISLQSTNRSIRRSPSITRYRCSPNRRRSQSLSPIRSIHRCVDINHKAPPYINNAHQVAPSFTNLSPCVNYLPPQGTIPTINVASNASCNPMEVHGPYDLRHRLGLVPTTPQILNKDDLRHRIRGSELHQPPPSNVNFHLYMEAPYEYGYYPPSNEYY